MKNFLILLMLILMVPLHAQYPANRSGVSIAGGGINPWVANGTAYDVQDVVFVNDRIYVATAIHSSTGVFNDDISNWKEISKGGINQWVPSIVYNVDDIVVDNLTTKLYRAVTTHTASLVFDDDITNWVEISNSIDTLPSSTDNAVVRFDGESGDLIQDSTVILDDSGNVSGVENLSANSLNVSGLSTFDNSLSGVARLLSGELGVGTVNLTTEVDSILPIANGGTNSSLALSNDLVMVSQGDAIVENTNDVSTTELSFLDGVREPVQTQFDELDQTSFLVTRVGHGYTGCPLVPVYFDTISSRWEEARALDKNKLATHVIVDVIDTDTYKVAQTGRYNCAAHGLDTGKHYYTGDTGGIDLAQGSLYNNPVLLAEDSNSVTITNLRASTVIPSEVPSGISPSQSADIIANTANIAALALVASSGDYNDLLNRPSIVGAPVDSVNGQVGVVVLDADDIDDSTTTHKFIDQPQLDLIATNRADIDSNDLDIASNLVEIQSNDTDISVNQTDIATNATNITNNSADIATNETNITDNDTDIASNLVEIQSNDTDIASNLTEIQSNDTDIAANGTEIANNVLAIDANRTDINSLLPNTADIAQLFSDTAAINLSVVANAANIATNQTDITNLSEVARTGEYADLLNIPAVIPAPVDSVNGQVGTVVLDADDIDDSTTNHKFVSQAEKDLIGSSNLGVIENAMDIQDNGTQIATNGTLIEQLSQASADGSAAATSNLGLINSNRADIDTNRADIDSNDIDISDNEAAIAGNLTLINSNQINIANNDSRITTNRNDIDSNDTDIATNVSDIASNSTDISTNRADIDSNDLDIASNLSEIQSNDADIASNLAEIQSNDVDIAANVSNIATNRADIDSNDLDIASNLSEIQSNDTDIASNLVEIQSNDVDIASNLAEIQSNDANITTNRADIDSNDLDIASNLAEIQSNDTDIATNVSDIASNLVEIQSNDVDIASNLAEIQSNDTDIATNVSNIASNLAEIQSNDTDIASNLSEIQSNDTDIATNVSNIASNLAEIQSNDVDIAANVSNIASNLVEIQSNDTDIATNRADIDSNDLDISSNLSEIQSNDTDIASNLVEIQSNDTDIATNASDIATETSDRIAADIATSILDRDRANHTGTQVATTISDFDDAVALYLDRNVDQDNTQQVNTTTVNNTRFNETYNLQHTAVYEVEVQYGWAYDITTSDIIVELLVNGAIVRTHEQEPQDSGGANGASGTNQQHTATFKFAFNATAGNNTFELRFRSTAAGNEATINYHTLTVERFL